MSGLVIQQRMWGEYDAVVPDKPPMGHRRKSPDSIDSLIPGVGQSTCCVSIGRSKILQSSDFGSPALKDEQEGTKGANADRFLCHIVFRNPAILTKDPILIQSRQ